VKPFFALDRAEAQGTIPKPLAKLAKGRARKYLVEAIRRVERASGLRYPSYYLEPVLPIARSRVEVGQLGVLYARVIPSVKTGVLAIAVQFTAALVAFAGRGTLDATAGHEFTHYVDLVRRLSRLSVTSDERATTLFESTYADMERTVKPSSIFKEKSLVRLIERKFSSGLIDERLNARVEREWIGRKLPVRFMAPDENVVRLGIASLVPGSLDPRVIARIGSLEAKVKAFR
jgi:hypothetical protein